MKFFKRNMADQYIFEGLKVGEKNIKWRDEIDT